MSLAWNEWTEVSTVICDKKMPMKLQHNIYTTTVLADEEDRGIPPV